MDQPKLWEVEAIVTRHRRPQSLLEVPHQLLEADVPPIEEHCPHFAAKELKPMIWPIVPSVQVMEQSLHEAIQLLQSHSTRVLQPIVPTTTPFHTTIVEPFDMSLEARPCRHPMLEVAM